jgi:hypothetical protein
MSIPMSKEDSTLRPSTSQAEALSAELRGDWVPLLLPADDCHFRQTSGVFAVLTVALRRLGGGQGC